ncbi:hypothetical protein C7H09_05835 [Marinobacter fuscus]|uniref:Uncharacterized protein n=1 Tax=Marinobacter fuscus TaxID=2109942 RepID=A0A2T1KPD0_9GAMM|nr:hypothetical protein [Marinobacter fuscus]PSF11880.1 hypothetical protein C7H09_05835 [Marinobacter fuscus]
MMETGQAAGWQMVSLAGRIAGQELTAYFDQGFAPFEPPATPCEATVKLSPEQIRPFLATDCAVWVILPSTELRHKDRWQSAFEGLDVQFGFGRAGLALAMAGIQRAGVPAQILAVESGSDLQFLALALAPGSGPQVCFSALDGRTDGVNDLGELLERAQQAVPAIDVLVCPDYPRDSGLDRLMPFLGRLSQWNQPQLRWEFPESLLPSSGVLGGLWGLYWLLDGYRLGDWSLPGALLLLDRDSALAGVIAVSQKSTGRSWQINDKPVIEPIRNNRELDE